MTGQKAKKEWGKPEIHLLSTANDVNGGGRSVNFHEVHTGNHKAANRFGTFNLGLQPIM